MSALATVESDFILIICSFNSLSFWTFSFVDEALPLLAFAAGDAAAT